MPRQNRVTPFGELIATSARGTLMGNRGRLHNPEGQIKRLYEKKAWIFCQLHFSVNGTLHKRTLMRPNSYTELFFLDEATALAAGHRPCNYCLPARLEEFCNCWEQGNPEYLSGSSHITVAKIDEILHQERLEASSRTKQMYKEWLKDVLNICFIVFKEDAEQPYLVAESSLIPWTDEGYGHWEEKSNRKKVWVLTPPSIVKAIAAGFHPNVHPSILACV
jgi:hypothetical protein